MNMTKFWEMFEKNVVISGFLAVAFGSATVYLAVTGQPIPDYLGAATATILGYFFGAGKAKSAVQVLRGK
jgi:hypothetical protein